MTAARFRLRPPTLRKLPPPLEGVEQEVFVKWWDFSYPTILIIASLNGAFLFGDGQQRARQGAKLKRQGMKRGVPDLQIPEFRLWFEMKRLSGGKLSDDQILMHAYLRGIGHTVFVAEGADQAMRQTKIFFAETGG